MSAEINNIIFSNNLDGYILPKNDNYFTEYSKLNNLKSITKFSGSAGFAIFLKNKKYLFVDGRYTIQAEKESGKKFKICEIPYVWPKDILKKQIKIGYDPDLFTWSTLNKYFGENYNLQNLRFIPHAQGTELELRAGKIKSGSLTVQVFEAKAPKEEFLKGLDVDLVKNASKDLIVGSMTSAKINGNWE